MLSKLNLNYNFEEETLGYVVEKVNKPKGGSIIKLYIPRIMQNIKKGQPKITVSKVQHNNCFINAPECKPTISGIFKEKNYLTGILENNSSVTQISVTEKKTYTMLDVNEEEYTAETIINQYIPEGASVRCIFKNGKLSSLRVNTDNSTKGITDKDSEWDKKYYKGKDGNYAK